ncbi:hypothetical protein LLG46_12725 [bacterium]|nr:hypothetical protein [bacterium]
MKLTYYIAPPGWTADSPNPFSQDGSYEGWSCFQIENDLDQKFVHGKAKSGLFHMRFGPNVDKIEERLADFLRYEPQHGRQVIMACPDDIDVDALVERVLMQHSEGSYLTPEESRWLVHSTDLQAWESIKKCGELRSLARLNRDGENVLALGIMELGEPSDYAEYVMLGVPGYIGPENVVASRKVGKIFTQEDTPYTPGARLYFDGRRIIEDGLAVYDGVHPMKVHDHLPLEPYLVLAVTTETVDPESKVAEWTPRKFLDAADFYFFEHISACTVSKQ